MKTLIRWHGGVMVALHWTGPGRYLTAWTGDWGLSLWPVPADGVQAQMTLRPVCELTSPADAGYAGAV